MLKIAFCSPTKQQKWRLSATDADIIIPNIRSEHSGIIRAQCIIINSQKEETVEKSPFEYLLSDDLVCFVSSETVHTY